MILYWDRDEDELIDEDTMWERIEEEMNNEERFSNTFEYWYESMSPSEIFHAMTPQMQEQFLNTWEQDIKNDRFEFKADYTS